MSLVLPDYRYGTPNHEEVRNTAAERAKIARHVEEFLARGGEIKQIPPGKSAYDMRAVAVRDNSGAIRRVWTDDRLKFQITVDDKHAG